MSNCEGPARVALVIGTHGSPEFPATQWSLVLTAGRGGTERSRAALEALCRAYWTPLYSYARREGHPPEVAQDLVQGFLARFLERDDLGRVGPEQGRFRSYLLAGLRNYLVAELRRERAQKRGGGAVCISLQAEEAEAWVQGVMADTASPESAFDRRWAETILERALATLREEHVARGKERQYEALKSCIAGGDGEDYAVLGPSVGMSAGAVAVAVHRMRHRLRELVRQEVAQTVGTEADLQEELRHLLTLWSR